ncbi:MAG: DUF4339 domain-containing protein [Verrucomicrobia bacterium]|nr:DUF4339 domain-containing protein [Verrucomicrobiota bacterium]
MTTGNREWLVLDRLNQPCGPYTLAEVCTLVRRRSLPVCKAGMGDWISAELVPEIRDYQPFGRVYEVQIASPKPQDSFHTAMDQLLRLCGGFVRDDYLSDDEIRELGAWLIRHQDVLGEPPRSETVQWDHEPVSVHGEWPGSVIADRVQAISV